MHDPVYENLKLIRERYYSSHPVFKYLFNNDASTLLKDRIRAKQLEVEQNSIPEDQYRRFLKFSREEIIYELLDEIKIRPAKDTLAKKINLDINNAQKILRTIDQLVLDLSRK